MKGILPSLSRLGGCESGAAAVEFALIALALILVAIGTIEFGRGLQLRNELSFAADFGARKVLLEPTVSVTVIEDAIRSALIQAQPELLRHAGNGNGRRGRVPDHLGRLPLDADHTWSDGGNAYIECLAPGPSLNGSLDLAGIRRTVRVAN